MKGFIQNLKKRPVLIIFVALATAVGCFAVQFNKFTGEFGSLRAITKQNYPALLTNIAEWLKNQATDTTLLATTIAIALLSVFAVAVVGAFFISGFSYVMYVNTYNGIHDISKKRKTGSLFKEGVNKRFRTMLVYIFLAIIVLCILLFLLAYITMPMAISIDKVLNNDTAQIIPMLLMIAVTTVVDFFIIVFYAMYVSYLMPSIVAFRKGSVRVAFKIVNSYCWYLIPRTLLFIVYNILLEVLLLAVGYGRTMSAGIAVAVFALNWVLRTAGILFYAHYVFRTYIEMKEDMFDEF